MTCILFSLVAPNPTNYSLDFKWSSLDLGPKSCGKLASRASNKVINHFLRQKNLWTQLKPLQQSEVIQSLNELRRNEEIWKQAHVSRLVNITAPPNIIWTVKFRTQLAIVFNIVVKYFSGHLRKSRINVASTGARGAWVDFDPFRFFLGGRAGWLS